MEFFEQPEVYAVKHKDLSTRMESRSGGIFSAVSDYVLEKGGIVYGCVLEKDFTAHHFRATTTDERNRMRGSKYIPSDMGDMFRLAKQDLENGRLVLFSGTSCQIAGLRSFLGKEYDNLFCIDIVCHGVPSLKLWQSYLRWQENSHKGKCIYVDFRNKKDFGWDKHIETLHIQPPSGKVKVVNSTVFKTIYYTHCALRPSCYYCPYKSTIHPADMSIADYWKIDVAAPGFNDNKGVSLVLLNNENAVKMFNCVKEVTQYQKCRLEDSMTLPLKEPCKKPSRTEQFWKDYHSLDFSRIASKYGGNSVKSRLKRFLTNH